MWNFSWEFFLWHVQLPSSSDYYMLLDQILFPFRVDIWNTKMCKRAAVLKSGKMMRNRACVLGLLITLGKIWYKELFKWTPGHLYSGDYSSQGGKKNFQRELFNKWTNSLVICIIFLSLINLTLNLTRCKKKWPKFWMNIISFSSKFFMWILI